MRRGARFLGVFLDYFMIMRVIRESRRILSRGNLHAQPVDPQRQERSARGRNGRFNARASFRLNHECQATSAARAAHLASQRALSQRGGDDAVDDGS